MRSSNKSRSRNKNNQNRRPSGNIVNRVFDSSGPEGKVRGTPQQIIEKYQALMRDAQLSGDRVAAENFQQHAEHYTRLLSEAMREQNERREQQEAQQSSQQNRRDDKDRNNDQQDRDSAPKPAFQPVDMQNSDQPDVFDANTSDGDDSGLVETPESKAPRKRKPRAPAKPKLAKGDADQAADAKADTEAAAE
ncbi:MAG: DUF4167 domain-containing protein [Rhodobacteraceae bacterium]|nr:DUF4167 domain-containing protein [Paracoccaceae bacterium]